MQVEEIRKKKALAEQEYRNSMPASSYQQQKLRVCEVCSAYLGIHDNDRRLADHFGGKLHLGFIKVGDFDFDFDFADLLQLKFVISSIKDTREAAGAGHKFRGTEDGQARIQVEGRRRCDGRHHGRILRWCGQQVRLGRWCVRYTIYQPTVDTVKQKLFTKDKK